MLINKVKHYQWLIILSGLVVLSYLTVIYFFALTIPVLDDYPAILLTATHIELSHHLSDIAKILFSQHNEHRIVTTRLLVWLQYCIFQAINFKALILFNNLVKVFLFGLITYLLPRLQAWQYLVLTLFFFQLSDYEAAYWAMGGASAFFVLIFALATIACLQKSAQLTYFVVSIFFSILAIFSNGNGLIVLPIGLLMLFEQRQYKHLLAYLMCSIVLMCLFFYHYQYLDSYQLNWHVFIYFFTSLGNIAGVPIVSTILGLVGIILLRMLLKRKSDSRRHALFYYLLFIIGSIVLQTISRSQFGVLQALSSRYKIYSIIFFTILYGFWIECIHDKKWVKGLTALVILIALLNLSVGIFSQNFINKITLNNLVLCEHGKIGGVRYPQQNDARVIIAQSKSLGIYNFYDYLPPNIQMESQCPIYGQIYIAPNRYIINKLKSGL